MLSGLGWRVQMPHCTPLGYATDSYFNGIGYKIKRNTYLKFEDKKLEFNWGHYSKIILSYH